MRFKKSAPIFYQILHIFLVAVVYYLTARLGFSINLAYVNAALWLPAGLAQAAVLIWGWHAVPGVFLGAFLFRWWVFKSHLELPLIALNTDMLQTHQVLLLAGLNAFGIAMQTWIIAWAIKATVKKLPPETVAGTLKTICVIALVSVLAPLLLASGLAAAGQLTSFRQYAVVVLDLWFTLFIGLTLITPAATVFGLKLRASEKVQQPILWPLASLIIGLSFFTFYLIESGDRQNVITASDINGDLWWLSWAALSIGLMLVSVFFVYVNSSQHARDALARSELKFRTLSENSLVGVMQQERSGKVVYANQAAVRIFDFESAEEFFKAETLRQVVDLAQYQAIFQKVLSKGEALNEEFDILTTKGEKRHLLYTAALENDVVISTLVDITDRTIAQQEIQKLSSIVSQMADTVVITDIEGNIEYVNPAFEKLTGFTREEVYGKTPRILKSEMHPAEFYQELWAVILRGDVFQGEVVNRKKNGELYYETKTITPIRDAQGVITNFVATGKDNTESRHSEWELLQSKQRMEATLNALPDFLFEVDALHRIVDYRTPNQQDLYVKPEEFIGKSMFDVLPADAANTIKYALEDALHNGNHFGSVYSLSTAEGVRWYELSASTKPNLGDSAPNFIALAHDVTERQRSQVLQDVLYTIAEAAQNAQSLQELYPQIHDQIRRVMYAENFYIALIVETTQLLEFVYFVDETSTGGERAYPLGKGLTSHIIRTGKSMLFVDGHEQHADLEVIGTPAAVWLGAPLIARGKTIGAIAVQHYSNAEMYTEREQRMLEFVSSQVATVIDRKQAEGRQEAQQKLLEYHYRLVEIMNSISTSFINLPIERIDTEIDRAIRQLGEFEAADRTYIFQFDSKRIYMNNTHEWCAPGVEPQIDNLQRVPIDVFPWWINKMEQGEAVYIPFVSQLSPEAQELRDALESQDIQSLLSVPLIINNKLFGFVGLDAVKAPRAWDADTILLIKMMGDIISNALMRKNTEIVVQQIERRNRALIENAPDGIILLDENGNIIFGSPSAARIFGYEVEEIFGVRSRDLVHPDDHPIISEIQTHYLETPSAVLERTYRVRHKDGSYRWIDAVYTNLLEQPGVNALVINFRDISEQKTAAEAVLQSESRFSTIFDSSPVGISITRLSDNRIIDVNRAWLADWGYERKKVIGHTTFEFGLWAFPNDRERLMDEVNSKLRVLDFETVFHNKSGEKRNVVLSVEKVTINEEPTILIQVFDITDRKLAAEMLQKSQESLEIAQSIAHLGSWELNPNRLDGMFWSSEMYRLFNRDPEQGVPDLEEFLTLVHPNDRQVLLDAQQAAIESGSLVHVEYRAFPIEGELRYFKAGLQSVRDEHGQFLHMSGTVLDVTDSHMLELELQERVKELTCLFSISRVLEDRNKPIERLCNEILETLEPAMRFSYLAAPVLVLDGVQYVTHRFEEGLTHGLQAAIEVNGKVRGEVCVYYTEDVPFIIPEERDMLGNIARMLGLWLEQRETEAVIRAAQNELKELNLDLEKRVEERTSEVRRNEAVYRALFENSNDGIFLLSPAGKDMAANSQALTMLGYTLAEYQELTRNDINAVAAPDQYNDANERFAAVLRGEYVPLYERTFIGKNGKQIDVEINLSPVRDSSGKIIMVQSVARDITERKKAEQALHDSRDKLSAANAALEKASRLKDEFLASMSHELRTPLTSILGLSEALQLQTYGTLSEKQLKALKNIETSGRHLLELINDILDLSKIEAGKLDMQFEPCNVTDICQSSLQLVKGMAHQKQQNIAYSINSSSIVIRADARRLKQMLVNLLSNAVKFTPNDGELGLRVEANEKEKFVSLTVWDKGIGISPSDLNNLFKPFVQLDSSLSRQYSGTGLGLSLVQRMTELHGGSIKVESALGEGSQFSIILPLQSQITRPVQRLSAENPEILKNALVVEDNILDAEYTTHHLEKMGIATIIQPLIYGALEKAAALRPSAIILDLHLPDGSGLSLLKQLKADARTVHIPVIICSVEERRKEARDLGAAGYLVKPYDHENLQAELKNAAAFALPGDRVMLISASEKQTVLMADDNELILETIGEFLQSIGFNVIFTRNGFELLERAPEIHPDIILVDIQMPGMDGMEVMRRLRSHSDPRVASAPIVAITALAMSGDREKILAAGANEYLSKPVSLKYLEERMRELL
jgi:PAS domain S-box-containing protein